MVLYDHQTTIIRILSVLIVELSSMGFGGASTFKVKFNFIIVKFIMKDLIHCL